MDWRVARPPLRSISTSVRQPRALLVGSPRPETVKSSGEGEARETKSPMIRLPLIKGCRFSKGPHPPFPHRPTGATPISLSLFTRPRGPIRGTAHCPPWGISREISTSHVTMVIPETLHNITSIVKRKNCKSDRNRPKVPTLTLVIPLRKGSRLAPCGGTTVESRTL
jgi:hypothetical protein